MSRGLNPALQLTSLICVNTPRSVSARANFVLSERWSFTRSLIYSLSFRGCSPLARRESTMLPASSERSGLSLIHHFLCRRLQDGIHAKGVLDHIRSAAVIYAGLTRETCAGSILLLIIMTMAAIQFGYFAGAIIGDFLAIRKEGDLLRIAEVLQRLLRYSV